MPSDETFSGNGPANKLTHKAFEKITVFPAREIITMCEAMPTATAVAVGGGRIVAVGTLDSLQPWLDRYEYEIDDRMRDKVLMPGFIDPHVHPSLPAVLTQYPFLAPDDWTLPTGKFPGAKTPESYLAGLDKLVAAHQDWTLPFVTWGYHPLWHGKLTKSDLTQRYGDKPIILWHRSFHELFLNDAALNWTGVTSEQFSGHPDANWEEGHFWENGAQLLNASRLGRLHFDPDRYRKGMQNFLEMVHMAGVTTCLDMGVGIFGDPVGETKLIRDTAESTQAPCRIILTPTTADFIPRGVNPAAALEAAEEWATHNSRRVMFDRHFKLQADGAIYSGLSQCAFPGYLDGHQGVWMAPPELLYSYAEPFWKAGYQLHAHINGDLSSATYIDIIRRLLDVKPRFGHRATLEHYAFNSEDQCRQMNEIGMLVSCNAYYLYMLSDIFSEQWLGPDRGTQMVRMGMLERMGMPFTVHSDCPMAPLSPLTLAWVAANRVTINGNLNCPQERVSLHTALKAITIDAAWILRKEDELGSIRAGKKADFAVLEENPYDVGAEGLKDVGIWGTVFEGEAHPLG